MTACRFSTAALIGFSIVMPVAAHEVWLTAEGGTSPRIAVAYGHPGDRSLPDKARLYALDLVTAKQPVSLLGDLTARQDANPALISAPIPQKGGAIVVARFDNGFWAQTPYGTKNTSRLNIPEAQNSMWSQKFAKVLVPGEGANYTRSVGQRLEIVPLADPFRLKAGESLRVRVEFEGKPVSNAEVSFGDGQTKDGGVTAKTDAQGIASLPLRAGVNILMVAHRTKGTVPQLAVDDALAATLSFTR